MARMMRHQHSSADRGPGPAQKLRSRASKSQLCGLWLEPQLSSYFRSSHSITHAQTPKASKISEPARLA